MPLHVSVLVWENRFYGSLSFCAMSRAGWSVGAILACLTICTAATASAQPRRPYSSMEIQSNWKLISANKVSESGASVSQVGYKTGAWYPIKHMPATVLQILEEDGVYPNLYYGLNLVKEPPKDLWKQDWWYRTTFVAPAGRYRYWLDFPGINYRAEIWLNGSLLGNAEHIVGMYVDHRFDVTGQISPGQDNVLAIKVTPERLIPYVTGVELGDDWANWINSSYFDYKGPFNPKYFADYPAQRGITAVYKAPGATGEQIAGNVSIAAASTSGATLKAFPEDGTKLAQGAEVTFLLEGKSLGASPVQPDGTATLYVDTQRHPDQLSLSLGAKLPDILPVRNAGVWKPVTLYTTGNVRVSDALVNTDLPLPATNPARLTIYVNIRNGSPAVVNGTLEAKITRAGKPNIRVSQAVHLEPGERREVQFTPGRFPELVVHNPALWWPYTLGNPALYSLHVQFVEHGQLSDATSIRFGIRKVVQLRDQDEQFAGRDKEKGGNFYIQINGRDFLIRGAAYTPDLLYRYDPAREATAIRYTKDMGLNMLRWESKISSTHIIDLADQAGVPVMLGWMCCEQWETWSQWTAEDRRVAMESLRSQILALRSHASVLLWANGSDGLPPPPIREEYRKIENDLHWQNALVDTVSTQKRLPNGDAEWDGVHMHGPYTWRPPTYWFSGTYVGSRGSCAEQGDNESVPPLETLKKFIPADKLWPPNEYWFFHAGALRGSDKLQNLRMAIDQRYGPSSNVEEFTRKAQVVEYEDTRAQFEDYAANGWKNHKMTIYWMLNSVWPSFYAHLYGYDEKPGGAYFGARKALRPLSVVFDYYARGDHDKATITVTNQTPTAQEGLRVVVRIYDLNGQQRLEKVASGIRVEYGGAVAVLTLPRLRDAGPVYFIRCDLFDSHGKQLAENVYWESYKDDDAGGYPAGTMPDDNHPLDPKRAKWADFTALNAMPRVQLVMTSRLTHGADRRDYVVADLHNSTHSVAFFERLEVTRGKGGDEILPITYSDNDVIIFPGESVRISADFDSELAGKSQPWLKLEGYNTPEETVMIQRPH